MSKVLEWLNGEAVVRDMTAEEVAERDTATAAALLAKRMARRCSRFQLKAALLQAGLWPQVQAWAQSASALQKLAIAEAPDFRRDSQVIADMVAGASLTEQQIDDIFLAAKAITA